MLKFFTVFMSLLLITYRDVAATQPQEFDTTRASQLTKPSQPFFLEEQSSPFNLTKIEDNQPVEVFNVSRYGGAQYGIRSEELEYLFENSKDLVCIIEFGGCFKRINSMWTKTTGWDASILLETPYMNFIHPDDVNNTLEYEKNFVPTGLVNRFRCKNNTYRYLDWIGLHKTSVSPNEGEEMQYPVTIARDITVIKKLEKEARRLQFEDVEALINAKAKFLAYTSHEMRSPLTGILTMLEQVNMEKLSTEDQECLKIAKDSGFHLLSILNNMLNISKMESGKLTLENTPFDPVDTIHQVVQVFKKGAQKKGLAINVYNRSSNIPPSLIGDATKFRQILFNLIGNAVKFTNEGDVSVFFGGNVVSEEKFMLEGEVKDTGIGISDEAKEGLFKSFQQGHEYTSRLFGGTGLGLHITKKLCELMDGEICFKNAENKGCSFMFKVYFQLDKNLSPLKTPIIKKEISKFLTGAKILIADDDELIRKILSKLLTTAGCIVYPASNGQEAVTACEKEHFDIVIMDGMMPELNGFEATKKIRKLSDKKSLPIIGLSGDSTTNDSENFLKSGANSYLSKPVTSDEIYQEMIKYLQK